MLQVKTASACPVAFLLILLSLAVPRTTPAQTIGGTVFEDLNWNGYQDAGETELQGLQVFLYGRVDGSGTLTLDAFTQGDGSFLFDSGDGLGNGCYVVDIDVPEGWRFTLPSQWQCPPGADHPVGERRFGTLRNFRSNLMSGSFLHVALGDSIAAAVNLCIFDDTDYIEHIQDRISCVEPAAQTDNRAVAGYHIEDLLTPGSPQYLPNIIALNPKLITISMGGNDFLGAEPGDQNQPYNPAVIRESVDELIATGQSYQEVLSTIVEKLPDCDVEVNTVYDNLAEDCSSTPFHNVWVPIWNQAIREVTWGQRRQVSIAEINLDLAHEDVNGQNCCGYEGNICWDTLHPNEEGAQVIEEALWETFGGANLGPRDGIGATVIDNFNVGLLERVATRYPSRTTIVSGTISNPDGALSEDGTGALVASGTAELRIAGFDAAPDDIVISKALLFVKYRTDASPTDDYYRIEASLDGSFSPPAYSVTGFNTIIPIVGGSGTSGNLGQPSRVLAYSHYPQYRVVSANLTKNPADDGTATGRYVFPSPTWDDIGTTEIRLVMTPVGAADAFHVE